MKKVEDLLKEGFRREDEILGRYDIYGKGFEIIYFDPLNGKEIRFDIRDN